MIHLQVICLSQETKEMSFEDHAKIIVIVLYIPNSLSSSLV